MSENARAYQLKPDTMLGNPEKRYRLGTVIGEGAFGITYIAYDTKLGLQVAVKEFYPRKYASRDADGMTVVLHKQRSFDIEALRDASIVEAKNLARLDKYEGVVEVRDYFSENNTMYIVMEYIDGINLKDYLIKRGGRISVAEAKKMIKPVMGALIEVHNKGLIHRDISPDNIMITKDGKMKLIDFGTAQETENADAQAWGKGGYAPLEQYKRGGNQGPWTDVYALAATFYHCITGQKPPMAKDRANQDTIVKPSQLGANISMEEEEALLTALAVDPDRRFRNMNALYNAFYNQKRVIQNPPEDKKDDKNSSESGIMNQDKDRDIPSDNRQIPLIPVLACVLVLLVGVMIYLLFGQSKQSTDLAEEPEMIEEATVEETSEEAETQESVLAPLKEQIDNGEYKEVIDTILKGKPEDADADELDSLLKEAIEGDLTQRISSIDGQMKSDNYPEALTELDSAVSYRNELSQDSEASSFIDNQVLDTKREEILSRYQDYVLSEGQNRAWNDDESGVDNLISTADIYLSGEEYRQNKVKVYSQLTLTHIDKLIQNGTSAIDAMNYIDSHLDKTDNNCWVLEFWDYFREVYRTENSLPNISADIKHVSSNGYFLDNSDKMDLTINDISHLSQYELYLARYEIYARHGRIFSDQAVNNYFSKYSWYHGTITGADFDESVLNEHERKNRNLIIEYERTMNYR